MGKGVMTPGTRLVQEWDVPAANILRRMGAAIQALDHAAIDRLTQEWQAALEDLARRIDAALAEAERRQAVAESDVQFIQHELEDIATKLAEREAQIAALRAAFEGTCIGDHEGDEPPCWCGSDAKRGHDDFCVEGQQLCADTATAARAFVERIQATERERCAQEAAIVAQQRDDEGWVERARVARTIEQRIRALGPKEE